MDFIKRFKVMACVSAAIIIAGIIVGLFAGGLNVGIDFSGGTLFTIDMQGAFDMAVVDDALTQNGLTDAQAVKTGLTASSQTMVDIRMRNYDDDAYESGLRTDVLAAIQQTYPEASITDVERVSGVASADLVRDAFLSVVIASVLILFYVWIRFELYSGFAAIAALLHDVAIMLAITCILRIPVNSSFIAAVLTIVGYSINNTIVIFDRIRENSKSALNVAKYRDDIVNRSISSTLSRSVNTSITTLLTVSMVYLLGVDSLKEFTLPIIIGLVAGAYSSIFLAGPLWATFLSIRKDGKGKK